MPLRLLNKSTGIVHDVADDHWAVNDPGFEVVGAKTPTISPSSIMITEPDVEVEPNWMPPLPEDFPSREKLIAAGYEEVAAVRMAADDELTAIKGISKLALGKIRRYLEKH